MSFDGNPIISNVRGFAGTDTDRVSCSGTVVNLSRQFIDACLSTLVNAPSLDVFDCGDEDGVGVMQVK